MGLLVLRHRSAADRRGTRLRICRARGRLRSIAKRPAKGAAHARSERPAATSGAGSRHGAGPAALDAACAAAARRIYRGSARCKIWCSGCWRPRCMGPMPFFCRSRFTTIRAHERRRLAGRTVRPLADDGDARRRHGVSRTRCSFRAAAWARLCSRRPGGDGCVERSAGDRARGTGRRRGTDRRLGPSDQAEDAIGKTAAWLTS